MHDDDTLPTDEPIHLADPDREGYGPRCGNTDANAYVVGDPDLVTCPACREALA